MFEVVDRESERIYRVYSVRECCNDTNRLEFLIYINGDWVWEPAIRLKPYYRR